MTVGDLAEQLNASPSTIRFWVTQGRGPKSLKVGRRRMFRPEDVEAWIERQIEESA
ncbi:MULTISPECIES: helix-turn-helix domain-containing protein [unclassified Leifsonia]|uniref:helix-turn-helix domain-containing protein n=1 Tax=unclassified Leifsonia TaxID=2663824 RepID=UPI0019110B26|nr:MULTISPECIES: helix-turn-helix domain-containing protein [unclassified Leifsonia]